MNPYLWLHEAVLHLPSSLWGFMSTQSMDGLFFESSLTFQLVYLIGLLSVQKNVPSEIKSLKPIQKSVLFSRTTVFKNACSCLENEKPNLFQFVLASVNKLSLTIVNCSLPSTLLHSLVMPMQKSVRKAGLMIDWTLVETSTFLRANAIILSPITSLKMPESLKTNQKAWQPRRKQHESRWFRTISYQMPILWLPDISILFFFHHKRKQRMSEHFVQPHGIAMGTKMAVAFSVIFMTEI